MLMRFDPFREVDRLTEAMFERTNVPRMPMDAYRHGDNADARGPIEKTSPSLTRHH
jgi:hypothetical protein